MGLGWGIWSFFSWAQLCVWCLWATGDRKRCPAASRKRDVARTGRAHTWWCLVKVTRRSRAEHGGPHAGEARDGGKTRRAWCHGGQ